MIQPDRSRLGVDLYHRQVGPERERGARGLEVGLGPELNQSPGRREGPGELSPGEPRLGRAGHMEATRIEVQHHVLGARLELLGGQPLGDLDEVLRGLGRGHPADLGRLRAIRAGAPRDHVGVACDHGDALQRQPQAG
jgi:hypothetical protein